MVAAGAGLWIWAQLRLVFKKVAFRNSGFVERAEFGRLLAAA